MMRLDLPFTWDRRFAQPADYYGLWLMEPGHFVPVAAMIRRGQFFHDVDAAISPRGPAAIAESGVGGRTVARLPIRGTMMKGQPFFSGTSTVQIRRELRAAANDPNVSGILLDIDSPGGTVAGTADLANEVRAARRKKPVWAHVDDLTASAGYWVASQADQVWANDKTALVGSIGTVLTVYDQSKAAEQEGIRPLVFATGPLKGAGVPGSVITEEQRGYFQGLVDESQKSFDAAVRSGRNLSAAELAAVRTGGVFSAEQALDLKLIDGIRSLDRTLEALARAK